MIGGTAKVSMPEKVELEITMRATVEEWRKIAKRMDHEWPDWQFAATIRGAIGATVERVETMHDIQI